MNGLMPTHDILNVAQKSKYPIDAFIFVQRGLEFTVRRVHGKPTREKHLTEEHRRQRHVDGQTLCFGLRDYAIQQYGLLAKTVLKRWKITECVDFGHIVFEMIDAGLMYKTAEDSLDDFTEVFDFTSAFSPTLTAPGKN